MNDNDLLELKVQVQKFLEAQPGYIPNESLKVICDNDTYFILYGYDIQVGVAGYGMTADGAFNDFVDNWNMYQGSIK